VDLRVSGWTLARIAEHYGLSRQRVAQIVDGSERGRVSRHEVGQLRRERRWAAARADDRSPDVIELWRQGVPREQISRRLGVTWEAIREIVDEHATAEDHATRKRACQSRVAVNRAPRFSEEQLIDGLWTVTERLGHVPTVTEYEQLGREFGLAAMPTVYARFGGWGPALQVAGLTRSSKPRGRAPRWDAATCWQSVLSVADQLGDPPRYRRYMELARGRHDLPSGPTLTLRLGLWSRVAAAIGEPITSGARCPAVTSNHHHGLAVDVRPCTGKEYR